MNLFQVKLKLAKFLGIVKDEVIPSMEAKREVMEQYRVLYNPVCFIETGTYFGDTIEYFRPKFELLYSIELAEDLHRRAQKRFESFKNVHILQGDSGKLFNNLLPQLKGINLFWLDGHYSSEFYVGEEYIKTARGESDTPILQELTAIFKKTSGPQIILIDDARLFTGKQDYPAIGRLKKFLDQFKRPYSFKVELDIIQIVTT